MVAIIKTSYSIANILTYNEKKVTLDLAVCIGAGNYPMAVGQMNYAIKLHRFAKRIELNENAKRNAVHISLNFSPTETLCKEKLMAIATVYMQQIGFGEQPYLVYEHYDAGHPHVHITTINIQRDGSRIDLHHLANKKSEPARKQIEEHFGLVRAQDQKNKEGRVLQSKLTGRIHYGRVETKKAITDILDTVLNQYKYANLTELNAILNLYNITSDKGGENSKMFASKGLLYRILDLEAKPIGVPIKASSLTSKPTLQFLETKFRLNAIKNTADQTRIKKIIDQFLLKPQAASINDLFGLLQQEGITTVLKKNAQDGRHTLLYVDHKTKTVFNAASLGKSYSFAAIEQRLLSLVAAPEKAKQLFVQQKQHAIRG